MATIILKADRDRSLIRRHPWVFSGAVQKVEGAPEPGATVDVLDAEGNFLARGAYSPKSQIVVRAWTFDPSEEINTDFFRRRLEQAILARNSIVLSGDTNAYRLVNAESDGLPGLVVDRYDEFLVGQFQSAGVERWKKEITAALAELVPVKGIFERSDSDSRAKEGLAASEGVLAGAEPPALVTIREKKWQFLVDIRAGQKTGFFLDQRENRARVSEYTAGAEVLNCFGYTGGFTIPALAGGAARVTHVEISAPAMDLVQRHIELNGLDMAKVEPVTGDVFKILRFYRDSRRNFDVIILDPPKFAQGQGQLEKAARGYKDINLLAFKLLRPGGTLITFSCSGVIHKDLFQKIVADAAQDARCGAQIVRWLDQAPDHPVALNFPEGLYLKGLICRTRGDRAS